MFLVTRSNLGVVERSFCLKFSSTGTQTFLGSSKMVAQLRRLSSLEAFRVKIRAAPATYVAYRAAIHLAEDTERLVNRL